MSFLDFFINSPPLTQAFLATCFTWGMTAIGAACVFFAREMSKKLMDGMLGFSAGIMIAASVWSLLIPAIELSQNDVPEWLPATSSFLFGGVFLYILDRIIPHLHIGFSDKEVEGVKTAWRRTTLLVLAITLHNIPEGLAVGVAFGAVASSPATLTGAIVLATGIGIQNLPEGLAVSIPLRREGMSRLRSFWYGQLSGVVEPLAAVVGAWAIILIQPILPYALGFAAGAMIFVVVEELIPESQRNGNVDTATMGVMLGFAVMMVLDVALG